MRKRRLIWALAVALTACAYVFENHGGTLTALLCAVLLPVFGLIPLAGGKVSARMEVPSAPEKGARITGVLILKNHGLMPVPRLELTVCCRNLRTGQTQRQTLWVSLLPGSAGRRLSPLRRTAAAGCASVWKGQQYGMGSACSQNPFLWKRRGKCRCFPPCFPRRCAWGTAI